MGKYISAIITAAGSSQRMNKKIPKQFLKIKDKMILEMTLDAVSYTHLTLPTSDLV